MATRRGFTLIEILIACVIVSIGLIGILALVTTTLKASGEVVEDSFATTLARSVYDAVRVGVRQKSYSFQTDPTKAPVRCFVLIHEGVLENATDPASDPNPPAVPTGDPATDLSTLQQSDFAIFLPTRKVASGGTATGGGAANPEPVFVFPRPTSNTVPAPASHSTAETKTQNVAEQDNFVDTPRPGHTSPIRLNIQRVYSLKNRSAGAGATGSTRFASDASDQYGFAIAVTRIKVPGLLDETGGGNPKIPWPDGITAANFPPGRSAGTAIAEQDGLYQVEVMVFRNFDALETSRYHEPVPGGRFVGLLAIGP